MEPAKRALLALIMFHVVQHNSWNNWDNLSAHVEEKAMQSRRRKEEAGSVQQQEQQFRIACMSRIWPSCYRSIVERSHWCEAHFPKYRIGLMALALLNGSLWCPIHCFLSVLVGLMLEIPQDFVPRLCPWVAEVTALRATETCTQRPAALSSTLQAEILLPASTASS